MSESDDDVRSKVVLEYYQKVEAFRLQSIVPIHVNDVLTMVILNSFDPIYQLPLLKSVF